MKRRLATVMVLAMTLAAPALAQNKMKMEGHDMSGSGAKPGMAAAFSDGEVRKVNKDAQKITIKHGPLPSLDMPMPMTMVYRVKDPAMLDQVKAGDKIRFIAEKIGGAFTVNQLEVVK